MSFRVLCLLATAAVATATSGAGVDGVSINASFVPGHYIRVDGRYYRSDGTMPWGYYFDVRAIAVPDVQMSNCRRPNGGPLNLGDAALYYGPTVTLLPINFPVYLDLMSGHVRLAVFTTAFGDVICDGEVPPPPMYTPDPDSIFADTFEI
jgi:hypothetical protein